MYLKRSVKALPVAKARLVAKPIVAKPNVDCIPYLLEIFKYLNSCPIFEPAISSRLLATTSRLSSGD